MSAVQIDMLSGEVRVFKDAVVSRVEPWIMVTRDAEVLGSFRESLVAMWWLGIERGMEIERGATAIILSMARWNGGVDD